MEAEVEAAQPPVLLLMGPTASGKTALALALAERLPVEIVSVDSALVYRGMDIGSAKPSLQERAQVPHHLIDILDPAQPYSAARFAQDAQELIAEIRGRGRLPLLVGGTMLYFRALQYGLNDLPAADAQVRARIEAQAREHGWPEMHARLSLRDPVTAARLHPNDQQRVQRALEIVELTGATLADFHAQPRTSSALGRIVKLGLNPPARAVLHERIERRFHAMMAAGFLEEVRNLHARGDLHPELPSVRAVGYRQLWAHLEGEVSLAAAVENGIAATRQFAKRQLTWLRSEREVHWLDPESADVTEQALIRLV